MAVDLQSLRNQLYMHHGAVVQRYLDHYGLTDLPEFTVTESNDNLIDAWHIGTEMQSGGVSLEVYMERPIEATRADVLTALHSLALFTRPEEEETPEKAKARRKPRSSGNAKTKAAPAAEADADAGEDADEDDAVPNS